MYCVIQSTNKKRHKNNDADQIYLSTIISKVRGGIHAEGYECSVEKKIMEHEEDIFTTAFPRKKDAPGYIYENEEPDKSVCTEENETQ